jgi:hypothetical protein
LTIGRVVTRTAVCDFDNVIGEEAMMRGRFWAASSDVDCFAAITGALEDFVTPRAVLGG